ncbi:hypothetical protein [Streptomyces sp. NPDC051994]
MSDNEILLLAAGINAGVLLMVMLNLFWEALDDRRDAAARRSATSPQGRP